MRTVITFESVTFAIKARKLLSRRNIKSNLIKRDSKSGCSHGLLIDSRDYFSSVAVLRESGLRYFVNSE